MVFAILGVLVLALALVLLKVVTIPIAIVLALGGLFAVVAIGERRARGRQRGMHDPGRYFDGSRGVLPSSAAPEPIGYAAITQTDVNVATQPWPRDDPARDED